MVLVWWWRQNVSASVQDSFTLLEKNSTAEVLLAANLYLSGWLHKYQCLSCLLPEFKISPMLLKDVSTASPYSCPWNAPSNFLATPVSSGYSLISVWAQNASTGVPGAAVAVLGDVVFFATSLVHCSSSALSAGLAFARTCRYCCEVDGLLTEGSKAAHALKVRLFNSIFSCRGKAHAVYALLSLRLSSSCGLTLPWSSTGQQLPEFFAWDLISARLALIQPCVVVCSKRLPTN